MSKVMRVAVAVATIELLLGSVWYMLAQARSVQHDAAAAAAQATIGSTMGMAMGGFLGFGVLMMFVAARNDRAARRPGA